MSYSSIFSIFILLTNIFFNGGFKLWHKDGQNGITHALVTLQNFHQWKVCSPFDDVLFFQKASRKSTRHIMWKPHFFSHSKHCKGCFLWDILYRLGSRFKDYNRIKANIIHQIKNAIRSFKTLDHQERLIMRQKPFKPKWSFALELVSTDTWNVNVLIPLDIKQH